MDQATEKCCTKCSTMKPLSEFARDASRRDGLQPWCRACHASWRHSDPERVRQKDHEAGRKYRQKLRQAVLDHYGRACSCPGCGATDRLTIDHVNGDGAEHRLEMFGQSRGGQSSRVYTWLIKQGFPDGFQVLCRSCNRSKGIRERCKMHGELSAGALQFYLRLDVQDS